MQLYKALSDQRIVHSCYHGKIPTDERKKIQKAFADGRESLLLATPAFGLGVDRADVRMVVHAQVPGSLESYYQEAGRAGRDGLPAQCVLLYDQDDVAIQMDFNKWAAPEPSFIKAVFHEIERNNDAINAGGIDALRGRLHFYHKRDFRLETTLNLLERWEFVEGSLEKRNLKIARALEGHLIDESHHRERLKSLNMSLLEMVRYADSETCRKQRIYQYFGDTEAGSCGECDRCLNSV